LERNGCSVKRRIYQALAFSLERCSSVHAANNSFVRLDSYQITQLHVLGTIAHTENIVRGWKMGSCVYQLAAIEHVS